MSATGLDLPIWRLSECRTGKRTRPETRLSLGQSPESGGWSRTESAGGNSRMAPWLRLH